MPKKTSIQAQTAPNYFLNVPKLSTNITTSRGASDTYKAMASMTSSVAGMLSSMQERNDKIAMTAFERKVASMEKTLDLKVAQATTTDDIDNQYKTFETDLDNTAKEMLGNRLYNTWNNENKTNYLSVMNDAKERAKIPVLQKEGRVQLDNLIDASVKDIVTKEGADRESVIDTVKMAIDSSTLYQDGSVPLYDKPKAEALYKTFLNKVDQSQVLYDMETNADVALDKLKKGEYTNLSQEQVLALTPKVQKEADKQERENLFEYAKGKYTDTKSGQVDYPKVISYLNSEAPIKELGVSQDNKDIVTNMAMARYNTDNIIKQRQEKEEQSQVYDEAFKIFLDGDVEGAIQYVKTSSLPGDEQYKIIKMMSNGSGSDGNTTSKGKIKTNTDVFSDLASRIVNEEIYDTLEINKAFANGDLNNTDRNALISLIKDVQNPASKVYKDAMTQVDELLKGKLIGSTLIDTKAKAYVKQQLTQEYRNALKDGKSLQELETMFNPVRVNALVTQYTADYPKIQEAFNKQMEEEQKQIAGEEFITNSYRTLQENVEKGIVTSDSLQKEIDAIEKDNTFMYSADMQEYLWSIAKEKGESNNNNTKTPYKEADTSQLINAIVQSSVAKGQAGKPILRPFKFEVAPAPNESIEAFTRRVTGGK